MFHLSQVLDGVPVWQSALSRGDVVLFRFPVAETDTEGERVTPKLRPCLVLDVNDRRGHRTATLAYGTSVDSQRNRGLNVIVSSDAGMEIAGLDRPTRFVGARTIDASLNNSGFENADRTNSPIIGHLDGDLTGRMNAVRAQLHAEAETARTKRRERRNAQRR